MTPAPARSHRRMHARPLAPRAPRRVSGPVNRRLVAAPAGAPTAAPRRAATGVFARVRALPDHRLVDRLLRSRLWIWALGLALLGVVTMQVSLLKLNSGISRAVETTTTLERQNAGLEAAIAKLSATDRIQIGAEALGMTMPPAGEVSYLHSGATDAKRAVSRMQPPSDEAAALLANGGVVPGSLIVPAATTATPTTTTTTTPVAPAPTPAPATQAPPAATPVPVTTPVTPQAPTTTSAPSAADGVATQG
jgi:hypothetical protein